jgi:hypothetical protein
MSRTVSTKSLVGKINRKREISPLAGLRPALHERFEECSGMEVIRAAGVKPAWILRVAHRGASA